MIKFVDNLIIACAWRKWYWLDDKAKWIVASDESTAIAVSRNYFKQLDDFNKKRR